MRYRNSVLGFLWVLIKPYSTFVVLYLIWTNIRSSSLENYSLYLLFGIVFYTFFREVILLGQKSLIERASVILKVNFPRQIAVLASLFNGLINYLINIALVVILLISQSIFPDLAGVAYFILISLTLFIFGFGVSLFTSIIAIRFRDLIDITDLGLFLLYWMTPIFFSLDADVYGDGIVKDFLTYNPIGILMNEARASLGIIESNNSFFVFILLGFSIILSALGWVYFDREVKKVAEYI